LLNFSSAHYPRRLKSLADAPLVLYYRGQADLNALKTVAIVGTRDASDYGRQFTEELVQSLQKHQASIVSGLAYGIDIAAHRAALKYDLPTIGVMASGINVIYPALHRKTAEQMILRGGLLTENRFGTKPDACRFPARNRIIAGLADAIIVVEAKEKGGALITAEIANNYNRDVFAVPGSVYTKTSEGCHKLIKTHKAHLLTQLADLEYIMNWDLPQANAIIQKSLDFEGLNLSDAEREIIALLEANQPKDMLLDEICWKLQVSVAQVSAHLLNLELTGLVRSLPGRKFTLKLR
ncbi:MAG: DNA-protecting protein DprA, partial [Bacteroidia bacterium]|nr:DNA-protecting protein DprA [Bacteroidia bacterium]